MRGNNVLGIIFSNAGEESIRELTEKRTFGSVPFGGRYRLIDFPLSNMVNSGINKVAVITKRNYQSLMNHLGSGKSWDLSRRRDGLFIFPPFGNGTEGFSNRIDMLSSISGFIKKSKEEYVILTDCNMVCNINYRKVINEHIKNDADITIMYKSENLLKKMSEVLVLTVNEDKRITQIRINPNVKDRCNLSMNMMVVKKNLLLELIYGCISSNKTDFNRDMLQRNVANYKMFGYEFTGFSRNINSMGAYFSASMTLMDQEVRNELFRSDVPIYTKVRDDMPAKYGLSSSVKNSIIGNGCVIDGIVENSIIFKGVKIGASSKVSNCVIMQDTVIGENCSLSYIITDKDVRITNGRTLMGFRSYPVYISKASLV